MKKWLDKPWAKVTFFCLWVLFTLIAVLGGFAILFLVTQGAYLDGGAAIREFYAGNTVPSYIQALAFWLVRMRYWIPVLEAAVLGLGLFCMVFTLRSAGHWEGYEGIHLTWFDRIPADLWIGGFVIGVFLFGDMMHFIPTVEVWVILFLLVLYVYLFLPVFSAQCKAGTVIRDSAAAWVLRLLWKGLRWLGYTVRRIPLAWMTTLFVAVMLAIDLICLANYWDGEFLVVLWIINALAGLFLIFLSIGMRKLEKKGQELAQGIYEGRTDTRYLIGPFRRHAKNLDDIQEGVLKAVDRQMRAERMKTELITNVSHDIKTPLTSIVNYVDLLKKEEITSPTAREYIDILDRQSQRLKKLTEDLVEASKAASGNLPAALVDTDVNVLLTQAAGEYEKRLLAADLTLVLTLPEAAPHILGDGQLLWRILDNLLNNAGKYAQPGTRVYLTAETAGTKVLITVRNISREPLNISAEELTERFVRGDSSRHTEGSGLGLSIAMSLTKLQNGEFKLSVDGDLFKAQLVFEAYTPVQPA